MTTLDLRTSRKMTRGGLCLLILMTMMTVACTGGRVTENGSAMAGASVFIRGCPADATTYNTTTDASGVYAFNPYDPNTSQFHLDQYVETGPVKIEVHSPSGHTTVARRMHQFNEICPIQHEGVEQDLPCDILDVDFVPMDPWEVDIESILFFGLDCGMGAAQAERLAEQDAVRRASVKLAPVPEEIGCYSRCAESCTAKGEDLKSLASTTLTDRSPCLCSCIAKECGADLRGFCGG